MMRKILIVIGIISLILLVGCQKQTEVTDILIDNDGTFRYTGNYKTFQETIQGYEDEGFIVEYNWIGSPNNLTGIGLGEYKK